MFRFFTVYGPWGRPDMAYFKFTKFILSGQKIDVYNYGNMKRDFTYIDDLVSSIRLLVDVIPSQSEDKLESHSAIDSKSLSLPSDWLTSETLPEQLNDFIRGKVTGVKAEKILCRCSLETYPQRGRTHVYSSS